MDGRNALGRRISLLNDPSPLDRSNSSGVARLTSHLSLRPSRTSSYASSSLDSTPPTPGLVRSDSSDSSNMNRTPSPVTPNYNEFLGLQTSPNKSDFPGASGFFPQQDPSQFPQIIPAQTPFNSTYVPPMIAPQPGPPSLSESTTGASSKGSKQQTKKNHYPCPLAKLYNCNDHFTTSGHAARHAKKHTGKKDAFCPECNKAFTRKDNMEQHRRTHQNGRSATKSTGEGSTKRQKTSKRSSAAASAVDTSLMDQQPLPDVSVNPLTAPVMLPVDPSLPQSPASSFGTFDPTFMPNSMIYPDPMGMPMGMQTFQNFAASPTLPLDPALSQSTGLDTLAMAAAKRDQDL